MSEASGIPEIRLPQENSAISIRRIEVNGKVLEYREYGNPNGIPILNLHGWLGGSAEGNENLSQALAGEIQNSAGIQTLRKNLPKGAAKIEEKIAELKKSGKYRIIAPELPGFGKSESLDQPSLDNMADHLSDFMKEIGMNESVVFGSSMGGILGIKIASRHPELVKTLVIQGTMTQPKDMQTVAYWMAKVATAKPIAGLIQIFPGFTKEKLVPILLKGSKDFKLSDEKTQRSIIKNAKIAEPHTALTTLEEIGNNVQEDMDKIKCPVVVMDGTSGDLVPIATTKEIAGRFHPQVNGDLGNKIREGKVMYFQAGGVTGVHTHTVVNSFPEGMALFINEAVDYFDKKSSVVNSGNS